MRSDRDLQHELERIDRRGYPAYKDLRGQYDFGDFVLSIDHVQGDPFASPSSMSVRVPNEVLHIPAGLWDEVHRRTALEDVLLRRFSRALATCSMRAGGSGKSGVLATTRPGQEVLARSACEVRGGAVTLRFEAGLPAHGRTVDGRAAAKMLLDFVPECVGARCLWTMACLIRHGRRLSLRTTSAPRASRWRRPTWLPLLLMDRSCRARAVCPRGR